MFRASVMANCADNVQCNDDVCTDRICRMKSYIEDSIICAAKHGFYCAVFYLGHWYSDEEIEDMRQYFDSLGYGCYLDNNNILEIIW